MSEHTGISSSARTSSTAEGAKSIEPVRAHAVIPIPDAFPTQSVEAINKALPPTFNVSEHAMYVPSGSSGRRGDNERQALRTRCRQLGVSLFFQEHTSVHSLGFTSAIPGEGKTFLAKLTAEVMAEDNAVSVTLLECNWDNPTLSSLYELRGAPGLSEWLLGRCPLEAIRQRVTKNLTVIPAGDGSFSPTKLLRELQQKGVRSVLASPDEVLILDLPATVTTAYGPLAAHLADVLILVVRMGVTPEAFVTEACNYLRGLPVQGIILNQVVSRIPGWLRRML